MDENNTVDFDAFWQEYSDTTPRQKLLIFGEKVTLPFDLPLAVEQRMSSANVRNKEQLASLLNEIYGEDVLDRWMEKGMGVKQMALLVSWTMLRVQGSSMTLEDAARAMENVVTSGKLKTYLENIGEQSKPTTNTSTQSTAGNSAN